VESELYGANGLLHPNVVLKSTFLFPQADVIGFSDHQLQYHVIPADHTVIPMGNGILYGI